MSAKAAIALPVGHLRQPGRALRLVAEERQRPGAQPLQCEHGVAEAGGVGERLADHAEGAHAEDLGGAPVGGGHAVGQQARLGHALHEAARERVDVFFFLGCGGGGDAVAREGPGVGGQTDVLRREERGFHGQLPWKRGARFATKAS